MAERLFHFVTPDAWSARLEASTWAPPSLANEGFVHLSFAAQLRGTCDVHYSEGDSLYLFEVDHDSIRADLKVEPSRGGALFPHLYRGLAIEEILGHWALKRDAGGRWSLPACGRDAQKDRPQSVEGAP